MQVTRTRTRRVLVAEHDPIARAVIAWALRRSGYDVVEASDAPAALDYVGDCLERQSPDPPDVVVVNSLQVLASLRDLRPAVQVIVTTALGDHRASALASRLGAAWVLGKPFDIERLCATVETLAPPR
jgi:DNA-binding response OmpR family regulator